jgi:hypothetical protein
MSGTMMATPQMPKATLQANRAPKTLAGIMNTAAKQAVKAAAKKNAWRQGF